MALFSTHSTRKQQVKMALIAGATAAVVTLCVQPLPARADLKTAIKQVEEAMTMLSTVAETGVAIALTPFGTLITIRNKCPFFVKTGTVEDGVKAGTS